MISLHPKSWFLHLILSWLSKFLMILCGFILKSRLLLHLKGQEPDSFSHFYKQFIQKQFSHWLHSIGLIRTPWQMVHLMSSVSSSWLTTRLCSHTLILQPTSAESETELLLSTSKSFWVVLSSTPNSSWVPVKLALSLLYALIDC